MILSLFFSAEFLALLIFFPFLSNVMRKRGKMNGAKSSIEKNRPSDSCSFKLPFYSNYIRI